MNPTTEKQEPTVLLRSFTVEVFHEEQAIEYAGPSWLEVIAGREVICMTAAQFGFAEEVLCMIEFKDGTFEVGIGEAIRPYRQLYVGSIKTAANTMFWTQLQDLAGGNLDD